MWLPLSIASLVSPVAAHVSLVALPIFLVVVLFLPVAALFLFLDPFISLVTRNLVL